MRPRGLLVLLLILFCLGMAGPFPGTLEASLTGRSLVSPTPVYPIAFRYRHQLDHQIRLLGQPSEDAAPRSGPETTDSRNHLAGCAFFPPGTKLIHLLMCLRE